MKERKNSNKPNRPTDEAVINLANMIISGVLLLAAMHLRRVTVQDFSKVLLGFCSDIAHVFAGNGCHLEIFLENVGRTKLCGL